MRPSGTLARYDSRNVGSCLLCVLINCDRINHVARVTLRGTCCYGTDLSSSLLSAIVKSRVRITGCDAIQFRVAQDLFTRCQFGESAKQAYHTKYLSRSKSTVRFPVNFQPYFFINLAKRWYRQYLHMKFLSTGTVIALCGYGNRFS